MSNHYPFKNFNKKSRFNNDQLTLTYCFFLKTIYHLNGQATRTKNHTHFFTYQICYKKESCTCVCPFEGGENNMATICVKFIDSFIDTSLISVLHVPKSIKSATRFDSMSWMNKSFLLLISLHRFLRKQAYMYLQCIKYLHLYK